MEWISVKDRMPKIGERVLVYDTFWRDVYILCLMQNVNDGNIRWYNRDTGWYVGDDVTHWMPLPEPPKEE